MTWKVPRILNSANVPADPPAGHVRRGSTGQAQGARHPPTRVSEHILASGQLRSGRSLMRRAAVADTLALVAAASRDPWVIRGRSVGDPWAYGCTDEVYGT
jgi:hypothetical protein